MPAPAGEQAARGSVDDTECATAALFRRMSDAVDGAQRQRIRTRIIELNLPLAYRLTHRYLHRGQSADDLRQVAALGLVKAVDGFDPARGRPFFGYLIPTVTGELKRHFRDHGWDVRVPRQLQERYLVVARTEAALVQRLRRAPGVAEIGAALGLSDQDVVEALGAAAVYDVSSLNARVSGEDDAAERQEFVGADDAALVSMCDKLVLRDLVRDLPERDRRILCLYFFGNLTQERIATELSMSQMNVSRLLRRILDRLRRGLDDRVESPAAASYAGTGISVDDSRHTAVVTVRGDVDPAMLRRALVDAVVRTRRGRVVADLRQAELAGPAVARALVDAYRATGSSGARLVAINVPSPLYDVLCRLGVTRVLACRPLSTAAPRRDDRCDDPAPTTTLPGSPVEAADGRSGARTATFAAAERRQLDGGPQAAATGFPRLLMIIRLSGGRRPGHRARAP